MKNSFYNLLGIACLSTAACFSQQPTTAPALPTAPRPPAMRLTSSSFTDGGLIPLTYTQASPNGGIAISPEFSWNTVPQGTQSFILYMHDIDVSVNKTTDDNIHWMVWNIPGTATKLNENIPEGKQADGTYQMSVGGAKYRGLGAPATGPLHKYAIELFALDIKLDTPPKGTVFETKNELFKQIQGHIIGKAAYVGLFKRPE